MTTDWSALWQALNDRQQAYLLALYELDQEAERANRYPGAPPASEWRWIPYATGSALRKALGRAGHLDEGTGSTWRSLEERGYLQARRGADGTLLAAQMTRRGRTLLRETVVPPRWRAGTLGPEAWALLVRLYEAYPEGVPIEGHERAADGLWNGPGEQPALVRGGPGDQLLLTPAGAAHVEGWRDYYARRLPQIKVPALRGLAERIEADLQAAESPDERLARLVRERLAGQGYRAAAEEAGVPISALMQAVRGRLSDEAARARLVAWLAAAE